MVDISKITIPPVTKCWWSPIDKLPVIGTVQYLIAYSEDANPDKHERTTIRPEGHEQRIRELAAKIQDVCHSCVEQKHKNKPCKTTPITIEEETWNETCNRAALGWDRLKNRNQT